jgi:hypothetical protein
VLQSLRKHYAHDELDQRQQYGDINSARRRQAVGGQCHRQCSLQSGSGQQRPAAHHRHQQRHQGL